MLFLTKNPEESHYLRKPKTVIPIALMYFDIFSFMFFYVKHLTQYKSVANYQNGLIQPVDYLWKGVFIFTFHCIYHDFEYYYYLPSIYPCTCIPKHLDKTTTTTTNKKLLRNPYHVFQPSVVISCVSHALSSIDFIPTQCGLTILYDLFF